MKLGQAVFTSRRKYSTTEHILHTTSNWLEKKGCSISLFTESEKTQDPAEHFAIFESLRKVYSKWRLCKTIYHWVAVWEIMENLSSETFRFRPGQIYLSNVWTCSTVGDAESRCRPNQRLGTHRKTKKLFLSRRRCLQIKARFDSRSTLYSLISSIVLKTTHFLFSPMSIQNR